MVNLKNVILINNEKNGKIKRERSFFFFHSLYTYVLIYLEESNNQNTY